MEGYLVKDLTHYCNISVSQSQPIEAHTIHYYDLTFVLEGTLIYHADGTQYTLRKNDAILLPPGTLRAREHRLEAASYVSFNFQIYEDTALPFPHFLPDSITPTIRRLVSIYPTSHLSPLYYSREKCMIMLNYILYELLDSASIHSANEHILKILKYIDEHIREKLTLQSISEQMNLSREYTSYLFKREMAKTLTDYVNERKLLLARELISTNELSLIDVARHVGFENYNYFCRMYKRQFGMSPGKLRKEACSKY